MTAVRDATGTPLTLGAKLGEGGEGSVYRVVERPQLVAKVYAKPPPIAQVAKLQAMVRACDDPLRTVAAWPVDVLYAGARPAGFTMPLVAAQHPLHELFGPRSRQEHFPDATWSFLIHTARNLARAFAVVHERDIVVGDVNSNNIVVCADSTARLIDCDSFQFRARGALFRCNVGVPDYQPPELQARDLSHVDRLPQHDLFGLAVVIFQLLFVGKHPFAGVLPPGVAGNGAIGANVAARRFFYGRDARLRGLRPPPGSPTLSAITPELAELFTLAFLGDPRRRPAAATWHRALEDLEGNTVACGRNAVHRHLRGAACPWCALERDGLAYFCRPGEARRRRVVDDLAWQRITDDDVERVWARIAAVAAPAPVDPALPVAPAPRPSPLRRWSRRRRHGFAHALATVAVVAVTLVCMGVPLVALAAVAAAVMLGARARPDARGAMRLRWKRASEARRAYNAASAAWTRSATAGRFREARARLAQVRQELRDQRMRRDAELAALERRRRMKAFDAYLASHVIATARIRDVDGATRAILRMRGIVTAADISKARLRFMPDLPRRSKAALVEWRERLERAFRAPKATFADLRAQRAVGQRIARDREALYAKLAGGDAVLSRIAAEIRTERPALRARALALAQTLRQADADTRVSPLFYRTWT